MPCPSCCGWNVPLMRRQHVTASGVAVAMPYQDWIVYTLHITHHQHPTQWGGEIEAVATLAQQPSFSLLAGDNPAPFPQNC